MHHLTVLYDSESALCRRVREWLEAQPKYLDMDFVAASSEAARERFPDLTAEDALEVTVINDRGEVYRGNEAWLICLWALRNHRARALEWGAAAKRPRARRFLARVSSLDEDRPLQLVHFLCAPALAFPVSLRYLGDVIGAFGFTGAAFGLTLLIGIPVTVFLRKKRLFQPAIMAAAGAAVAVLPLLTAFQPMKMAAAISSGALIGYVLWRAHAPDWQEAQPYRKEPLDYNREARLSGLRYAGMGLAIAALLPVFLWGLGIFRYWYLALWMQITLAVTAIGLVVWYGALPTLRSVSRSRLSLAPMLLMIGACAAGALAGCLSFAIPYRGQVSLADCVGIAGVLTLVGLPVCLGLGLSYRRRLQQWVGSEL